ncbi:uncharacterized protein EAF02_006920 [Botrytis sinoallii]|uniref:uncharacterized protein n=1 Tax=Botrytis sinoallii TaxID=1463999 RepID=UPI001900D973|nr:uncharacterized protein EAF02_006920 [Botrytis sinoallii]KAF7881029.1 hypothetical protein EAF02_006920 [Botrytis sinoallii]
MSHNSSSLSYILFGRTAKPEMEACSIAAGIAFNVLSSGILSNYPPPSNVTGGILAIGSMPGFTPKGTQGSLQLCPNDFLDATPGYLYSNGTLPLIKPEANGDNLAY